LARTAFIYSSALAEFKARPGYPWIFDRTEKTYRLCDELGLFDPDHTRVHHAVKASRADLLTYHTSRYIGLLEEANQGVARQQWLRYGLGTTECPVYPGVFDYHRLAAGCTLKGVSLIEQGKAQRVFNPTGGFHHAGKDFAAGFCYVNDAVLAIKNWRRQKKRVLYVDIDAHHGDQVQEAFYDTDQVMTISFHESGTTLYPFKTGFEHEIGKGRGKGYAVNVPMPENTPDEPFLWAFDRVFPPLARAFCPDVVVATLGADSLFSDPLSHLQLTNNALAKALETIVSVSPKLLLLGGGGYEADGLARAWARAWAILSDRTLEAQDTVQFGGMFWGDGLAALNDRPRFVSEKTRNKVKKALGHVVRTIENNVFPRFGPLAREPKRGRSMAS